MSKCTGCGSPAYVGFLDVHCTNKKCAHYNHDYHVEYNLHLLKVETDKKREAKKQEEERSKRDTLPCYPGIVVVPDPLGFDD